MFLVFFFPRQVAAVVVVDDEPFQHIFCHVSNVKHLLSIKSNQNIEPTRGNCATLPTLKG